MTNNSIIPNKGKNVNLYRTYTENVNLSATEYLAPTKVKLGVNNKTPEVTDLDLTNPIPLLDGVVNDDGSNNFTGSLGGDNSTDNISLYKPGAGVVDNTSQDLIANGTNVLKTWTISALTVNIDPTKYIGNWFNIKDADTLAKLKSSGTCLTVKYALDASNYYSISKEVSELAVGWNWITSGILKVNELTLVGTVATSPVSIIVDIETNNASDTFVAGDMVYDLLRTWDESDTLSAFQTGYPTFDYSNNEVTIRIYVDSTKAVGFDVGSLAEFNEDTIPLMTGEDKFTPESKGTADEFAFITKNRSI